MSLSLGKSPSSKRVEKYIENETFMLTYGDGVSDVPLDRLAKFHKKHGKLATLTAVHPEGRFGMMDVGGDLVNAFREKDKEDVGWVNGGFMVLEPEILDYIEGDSTVFEKAPLTRLSKEGNLAAFRHDGFWQCMDTLRDREMLEENWSSGRAPWKLW